MTDPIARLNAALSGRYRIERELGEGGMATVYLADDLRHDREVALKVLKPELAAALGAARFHREIETTARLRHPNVLPLYDSGDAEGLLYYIAPYVPEGSLRDRLESGGPLPVAEALQLTNEVADALSAAHEAGVIHRDIKPANILLERGHAVVADFGIARALDGAAGSRLTRTGSGLGTPGYMSPEQAFDEGTVDHRSDIYSLGCLLYEMLTGEAPFVGRTAQSVLAKQATQPAPSVRTLRRSVPEPVDRAIRTALASAPVDRFDSVQAFADALEDGGGDQQDKGRKSIVVLPFENLSPDPDDVYFSDGLTDEIISDLAKLKAVQVISRATSSQLKGTTKNLKTIGRDLGVQYALTGTVRRAGDSLRITSELAEARTERSVWGDKYTGTVADVFELQEQLSRRIVDALEVVVTPDEARRFYARPIADVKAYDRYLMAREELHRFTPEGFERADQLLTLGLEDAPDNALLIATRAHLLLFAESNSLAPSSSWKERVEELANRALQIDPLCAVAHEVLGLSEGLNRGKVAEGIRRLLRARELEPSNSSPLMWLVELYSYVGRTDEAIEAGREAVALDPWSWIVQAKLSLAYLWGGRLKQFYKEAERIAERHGGQSMPDWFQAAFVLSRQGRVEEMRHLADRWLSELPDNPFWLSVSFFERALSGDRDGALALATPSFDRWSRVGAEYAWLMSGGYVILGEVDDALELLTLAVDLGFINYPFLSKHDRFLQPLWKNARGIVLLDRVKAEWESFGFAGEDITSGDGAISTQRTEAPVARVQVGGDPPDALPDREQRGRTTDHRSIVVVPFVNRSSDPEDEYFSDGLTDEIITDLSSIGGLRVISRNSSMLLKGSAKDTPTIAREVGVSHVLTGSVRRAGDGLRITAELVEGVSDAPIWSEKYSGSMAEVFEIQEDVSRSIAEALSVKLSPTEDRQLSDRPIEDVTAYECFLRARYELWRFTPEALGRAEQYLKDGLAVVGDNALLYAGLGRTYAQYWLNGISFDDELLRRAEECADKCLALAPRMPHGHYIRSLISGFYGGLQGDHLRHASRALQLAPDDPDMLAWVAHTYCHLGKLDQARPLLERARRLDPLTPIMRVWTGFLFWLEGRFEQGREQTQQAYDLAPLNFHCGLFHGISLGFVGRVQEAEEVMGGLVGGGAPFQQFLMSIFLAAWRGDAAEVVRRTESHGAVARRLSLWSVWVADCHALVGEKDRALDWLGNAVDRGLLAHRFISEYDPFLDNIRGDPHFNSLVERARQECDSLEVLIP